MIKKFQDFINEGKEPEIFSGYNGRYLFDVDKAYSLINSGEIGSIRKTYPPYLLNQYSREDFSFVDPLKMQKLKGKMDYSLPIGLLVKFKNPETPEDGGEWILIDGNHRVRTAAEEGKPGDLIVVPNPSDVDRFMTVDTDIPHELFPDY
jgi:hypothetical protein